LLRRFRLEVRDTEILPRPTARLTLKPLQDTPNDLRMHTPLGYSFIPAKAALRSHNAKAARSSSAGADGVVGRHL